MKDLYQFVGKTVLVTLYRNHKFRTHTGRLVSVDNSFLRLMVNNRIKWVRRPRFYKDSITEVDKT